MKQGFTLIELILAFAIIGMLMVGVTLSLTAVLRSTARTSLQAKVTNEGEFLMESIAQMTRYSPSVNCGFDSISPNPQPILQLAPKTPNGPSPIFTCLNSNDIASSSSSLANDTLKTPMNSNQVTIGNCSFTCNGTPTTDVDVSFTVVDKNQVINPIYFDTDIVLRNPQ